MKKCEIVCAYNEKDFQDAYNKFSKISDTVEKMCAFGNGFQFYSNYECIAVLHKYY
jgi:hypothetical protein